MVTVINKRRQPSPLAVFGKTLGEGIPKIIEQRTLSSGLQQLEKDAPNLTPEQYYTRALQIPGLTPEATRQLGELTRQKAQGQALQQRNEPSPFPQEEPISRSNNQNKTPSITESKNLEQAQQGYIPPTQEEIISEAGRQFNANPALFGNDPQKAIQAAETKAAREEKINEAHKTQHKNLTEIQDNVVRRLESHSTKLGVNIPANVYSKIEDQAILATKPVARGGKGLTEQQAMKEYGEKLDEISRDYSNLDSIGNWGITGRKAKNTLTTLSALQKSFRKNKDTENAADTLIAKSKVSPDFAYSIFEPVQEVPELNNALKKVKEVQSQLSFKEGYPKVGVPKEYVDDETYKISEKLAPLLGKMGSPLSVAYELKKKGLNPEVWIRYLSDHQDDLGLKPEQVRQLSKSTSEKGTFNDWWLQEWSGIK